MKRLGVAGIITSRGKHKFQLLMGRRGKDPNRGLFVLPGGGVRDNESLEEAFCREIMEETGLQVFPDPKRWSRPTVIELSDRIILVGDADVVYGKDYDDTPRDGGDLYDVGWFRLTKLPHDVSPVIMPVLNAKGFFTEVISNLLQLTENTEFIQRKNE